MCVKCVGHYVCPRVSCPFLSFFFPLCVWVYLPVWVQMRGMSSARWLCWRSWRYGCQSEALDLEGFSCFHRCSWLFPKTPNKEFHCRLQSFLPLRIEFNNKDLSESVCCRLSHPTTRTRRQGSQILMRRICALYLRLFADSVYLLSFAVLDVWWLSK